MELTSEEKKAVAALKRLSKKWPDTLWLFAENNKIYVMRKTSEGSRCETEEGAYDQDSVIAQIDIEAGGGQF